MTKREKQCICIAPCPWPATRNDKVSGIQIEYRVCLMCRADLPMGPAPNPPARELWLAEMIRDACILRSARERDRSERIATDVDYASRMT